jgi:3'-5' exoribonuclease
MPNSRFDGNAFPEVFCIEDIRCARRVNGGYDCRATLYHDRASISVTFSVAQRNPRFRRGRFVSVEWLPEVISDYGAVKVAGLCARDCAASGFNPFQSVPHSWCVDRHQIECARDLWDFSSQQLRKLLFETFWNGLHARRPTGGGGYASEE